MAEAKMGINEKIAKLDEMTEWFYSEDFKLEEASKRYREAMTLEREIEQDLDELKNEIEIIDKDFSK
ncbi:exodeoxyribonuclease VII small subunit [Candidatus Saccharibacteria bacterium]|nr:exodeoxyribonuclease VII small subunit [Candidatus Saccharibacteria bacterium]